MLHRFRSATHYYVVFYLMFPQMMGPYNWSPIIAAVHFLPVGISATITAFTAPALVKFWSPKYTISAGLTLEFIATMLLPFMDDKSKYWRLLFPACIMCVSLLLCLSAYFSQFRLLNLCSSL